MFPAAKAAGHKLLVPYITGGYPGWADAVRAAAANGADAIEIGIPFSDPVMDGPVIQQASLVALEAGAIPPAILDEAAALDVGIPLAVMTYYNIVHHDGHRRFAGRLVAAGVSGCILPDLPLEESGRGASRRRRRRRDDHARRADRRRTSASCASSARSRGFVYSVGLLGVTGERTSLAATATALAARLLKITDKPVLVGVGVSNAEQAREACRCRRRGGAGCLGRAPADGGRCRRRRATTSPRSAPPSTRDHPAVRGSLVGEVTSSPRDAEARRQPLTSGAPLPACVRSPHQHQRACRCDNRRPRRRASSLITRSSAPVHAALRPTSPRGRSG